MNNSTRRIRISILLVLFISTVSIIRVHAQDIQPDTDSIKAVFNIYDRLKEPENNGSKIVIEQDARVKTLLRQHFDKGGAKKNLIGWRIRIFRDNSQSARDRSLGLVGAIKQNYPGTPVYRDYSAPYYYVAVGDFRTQDEAEKMKKDLQKIYPGASLIKVPINFPPL